MKRIFKCAGFIIAVIFMQSLAFADNTIDVINSQIENYPNVKSRLFVFDDNHKPVFGLNQNDFIVKDNGNATIISDYKESKQNTYDAVSLVLSMDLAISSYQGTNQNFTIAQNIANKVIARVLNNKSECSIASFDRHGYLNQEFTNDSALLVNAIDELTPSVISNYSPGILFYPLGAISIAEKGNNSKSILLITDNKKVEYPNQIIEMARQKNIKIYCLVLDLEASQGIKDICDSSGGHYFDKLTDSLDIEKAVNSSVSYIYNYSPSQIIWQPQDNCEEEHIINFSLINNPDYDEIEFQIPDIYKPALKIKPEYLNFSAVLPGKFKDMDLTFTAQHKDIIIHDLSLTNPVLKIIKGGLDAGTPTVRIPKDSTYKITIRYTPADSSLVFDSLNIGSNACLGKKVLITAGFPNTPPKQRNLTLIKPVCGNVLSIGDTVPVEWSGLLPTDVIQLEYSINSGKNWEILAKNINGLIYNWQVPEVITDSLMIRAMQLWPNNVGRTMDFHHSQVVETANFNELGDLVVTSSDDSTVAVWNANNGYKLHILLGHTGPIRWANFSPDGKKVVSASDDSTIIVWDISNPEIKNSPIAFKITGHSDFVKSANFSNDGKYIVSASWDGTAKLWDAKNGKFIRIITSEKYKLWYAVFSPDDKYIMTSGNSRYIKLWNAKTGKLYKELSFNNGTTIHGSFSSDGKKLVTAGWYGKAVMWDILSGDTLFTVVHPDTANATNPINSASFDFSGDYFLTTSIDNTARLWNAHTGELKKILKEHRSSVQFAVFNFDGRRILTASADSTAKIWNLEKTDLQTDTSDCLYSIKEASAKAFDIAFGDVVVNESKYMKIDTFIINNVDFDFEIKDIKITGENAEDFEIIDNSSPFQLEANQVEPIFIKFTPSIEGDISADIEIDIPGKKITQKISGRGIIPELQASVDYIDFGDIELGDFKDSTLSLFIKNISKKDIVINSIKLTGPDDKHFKILNVNEFKKINAGESKDISLRFIPEQLTLDNSKLVISYQGAGQESVVSLIGQGIKPRIDTATISIASFSGLQNNIYEVPIKISNLSELGFRPTITGFQLNLKYNATMLEYLGDYIQSDVNGYFKTVSIQLPVSFDTDSVLTKLKFKVALGNDTLSPLTLSDISLLGKGKTMLSLKSGEFKLEGYCEKGGLRLFESDGKIVLSQNRPNPFEISTTIDFEVFEGGETKLYICNIMGENVKTIVHKHLMPGKYSYLVDFQDLPAGMYYYILQTPTFRISRRMEISR